MLFRWPGSLALLPFERVRGRKLITFDDRGGDSPGGAKRDWRVLVGVDGLGGTGAGAGAGAGGGLNSIAMADKGGGTAGRGGGANKSGGFLTRYHKSFNGFKSVIFWLPFRLNSSNSEHNFPMD